MAVNKLDITMMEDVGTSASQLLQRDGSGNIPAVDGSQVTGLSEFTTSTSDPAIDTNPSGGVGSLWYNKTGGEMYVCTDATAGANVWKNVGVGSDNIQPWLYGGTQYGFSHCGAPAWYYNTIDKWSFTSGGNATDVGDNTDPRAYLSGNHSSTHGYIAGGETSGMTNIIDKNSYAAVGNSTDVGDLTVARYGLAGTEY